MKGSVIQHGDPEGWPGLYYDLMASHLNDAHCLSWPGEVLTGDGGTEGRE